MKRIVETINVKIVLTEKGQVEAAVGGAMPLIGKWLDEYRRARSMYEDAGYAISDENTQAGSFVATKEYER